MKKIIISSILLLSAGAFISFKLSAVLPIGSDLPMPDAKVIDIQKGEINFKEAKKKNGLLVMFSCNTCPYVIKNQERTREICKYALENNIGVILLNSNEGQRAKEDSYDAMQVYAKEQKYNWYYAVDKDHVLADAFGANRTPENFLFNKDLKLIYHGAIDDNPTDAGNVSRRHLKEAIDEAVAGKDVSVKETRSMGCSIKRKG